MTRQWVTRVALALALAVYFWSFHDVDLNLSDEGYRLAQAVHMERVPLTAENLDQMLESRLGCLLYLWGQVTGRPDVAGSRLLWLLMRVGLALIWLAVARRMLPRPLALLAAVLAATACGPWHKVWYPLALGTLVLLARPGQAPCQRTVFKVGLAAGVFMSLFPVGIIVGAVLPVGLYLLISRARRVSGNAVREGCLTMALFVGAAGVGAVLLSTLQAAGILLFRAGEPALLWRGPLAVARVFVPPVITTLFSFATTWSVEGQLSWIELLWPVTDPGLVQNPLGWVPGSFFLALPLVLLIAVLVGRGTAHSSMIYLLVLVALANLIKLSVRSDLFHALQGGAPAYALALFVLWRGVGAAREAWPRWDGLRRSAAAAGLLTGGALFPLIFGLVVLTSPAQWASSAGSLALAEQRLDLPRARVWLPRERARGLRAVTERIRAHSSAEDPVLVLPYCPGLYLLSERSCTPRQRLCPHWSLATVPGMGLLHKEDDRRLARLLASGPVRLIVFCPPSPTLPPTRPAIPETMAHIAAHYDRVIARRGWELFRLREQR